MYVPKTKRSTSVPALPAIQPILGHGLIGAVAGEIIDQSIRTISAPTAKPIMHSPIVGHLMSLPPLPKLES
jgi:hypothetical protein